MGAPIDFKAYWAEREVPERIRRRRHNRALVQAMRQELEMEPLRAVVVAFPAPARAPAPSPRKARRGRGRGRGSKVLPGGAERRRPGFRPAARSA